MLRGTRLLFLPFLYKFTTGQQLTDLERDQIFCQVLQKLTQNIPTTFPEGRYYESDRKYRKIYETISSTSGKAQRETYDRYCNCRVEFEYF